MRDRPDRTAALCLGIASVLYIGGIISLRIDSFLFPVFVMWPMLALLAAAIFLGARALKIRRNVWNLLIVIVSSLMLVPFVCAFTAGITKILQQS